MKTKLKRKRIGKTNYKKRLTLLKSKKPRLVIRKTNKYIIAQIVEYTSGGDRIVCAVSSKQLLKLGWNYSAKNIPACYLTGKLLAQKKRKKKLKDDVLVLDLGLHTPVKGARLYSVVKGAADAGLNLLLSKDIFPKEDRILGDHIIKFQKQNKDLIIFSKCKDLERFMQTFTQISKQLD